MTRSTLVLATMLLASATSLEAHHSSSMFELTPPVWLKGTVVSYDVVNPHTTIVLEERFPNGEARRWTVEGPNLARFERMHLGKDLLKAGDVIEACAFSYKEKYDLIPQRQVHGHMLVMPNGRMQPWGPYGKLDNCVRPEDSSESWLHLLDADAIAHDLWCRKQRAWVPTLPAIRPLVAAIDERMATPCE